ncbi:hypothetical protein ACF0H5_007558 [Mactra antiquata]
MKICILLLSAYLCFQPISSVTDKARLRECRMGRCKFKLSRRLRLLRDLSKSFYRETNIDSALKALHNRKGGSFGAYDEEGSNDIPKLVCPPNEEGKEEMLACPTPDRWNRIHCIEYYNLCDHTIHCPNGEDEDPTMCLFHSATNLSMKQLVKVISQIVRPTQEILSKKQIL